MAQRSSKKRKKLLLFLKKVFYFNENCCFFVHRPLCFTYIYISFNNCKYFPPLLAYKKKLFTQKKLLKKLFFRKKIGRPRQN